MAGYSRFIGNGISYQLGGGGVCRINLRRDFRLEDAAEAVSRNAYYSTANGVCDRCA